MHSNQTCAALKYIALSLVRFSGNASTVPEGIAVIN